jgi:hypothetical protein
VAFQTAGGRSGHNPVSMSPRLLSWLRPVLYVDDCAEPVFKGVARRVEAPENLRDWYSGCAIPFQGIEIGSFPISRSSFICTYGLIGNGKGFKLLELLVRVQLGVP